MMKPLGHSHQGITFPWIEFYSGVERHNTSMEIQPEKSMPQQKESQNFSVIFNFRYYVKLSLTIFRATWRGEAREWNQQRTIIWKYTNMWWHSMSTWNQIYLKLGLSMEFSISGDKFLFCAYVVVSCKCKCSA